MSYHIVSITDSYGALKKLKDLYDSHSKSELVQLMVKLFNLELKDDDLLARSFEIRVKIDILLTTFIKALYPTYSHYLEFLQATDQLKSIICDSLVEKNVE